VILRAGSGKDATVTYLDVMRYVTRLLQITHGNVTHAAGIAKRNRTAFYKLLQRQHANPTQFKAAHP